MVYRSPSEERDYARTYAEISKCRWCGSRNLDKWRGSDSVGDLVVVVRCESCQKQSNVQLGLHHDWT